MPYRLTASADSATLTVEFDTLTELEKWKLLNEDHYEFSDESEVQYTNEEHQLLQEALQVSLAHHKANNYSLLG